MGDKGSIIIQPIESKGNMSGGVLTLALEEDRGGFKRGIQTVDMPPPKTATKTSGESLLLF